MADEFRSPPEHRAMAHDAVRRVALDHGAVGHLQRAGDKLRRLLKEPVQTAPPTEFQGAAAQVRDGGLLPGTCFELLIGVPAPGEKGLETRSTRADYSEIREFI